MFDEYALWIKSAHVISVLAWMAALLYLPRLFVYHCDAEPGSVQSETFKVMERRLLRGIATPSMIATWVFGLWTAFLFDVWSEPWFHIKLLGVLVITVLQFMSVGYVKAFADDANTRSSRYFRIINEVPALLMIVIVIMVVVKPF